MKREVRLEVGRGRDLAARARNVSYCHLGLDVTIEPDWLSEHVGVLPEDRVRIDPALLELPGDYKRQGVGDVIREQTAPEP